MKKATRIALYAVIAVVCIVMLAGYVSTFVCNVPAFWIDPVPLFTAILGIGLSNLDIVTLGAPICGICLMLLYIDVRERRNMR